jgi:alkanesulfonate monooxygenase SsuD/methylene tetrahydromethanopterin reductase-like flavin-dependent oxidoreductase (luciferase family)
MQQSVRPSFAFRGDTVVPDLKLGINLWSQATDWPAFLDAARRADRLGYDSLWTWDHLHAIFGDPHQPIFEGWTTMGAWAVATERIRLGLMVGANTLRNPGLVAKSVATLDHASDGRAILGLGGAWFEHEHAAHGIEFGRSPGQRLAWLDESVAACRTLLDGGTVTSPEEGRYAFRELRHEPLPVQPHLPIMIGGSGRRKTLRIVARHADQWNASGTPAVARELDGVLREHCDAVGRDHREIQRTINLWMVIRDSEAEAQQVWAAAMAHNRTPLEDAMQESRPLLGPVGMIAERLSQYVEAGFPAAIVEIPAPFDVETMERLIGEVKPLVDGG